MIDRKPLARALAKATAHADAPATRQFRATYITDVDGGPQAVYLDGGITTDVERVVAETRDRAAELAAMIDQPVDWRVDHRTTSDTDALGRPWPRPLAWSSWSGTARPGDRDRAPFEAVDLWPDYVANACGAATDSDPGTL